MSDRGQLAFDQLPWFSVAERLEREKEALTAEREGVRAQMALQAEVVARIEEQMQVGAGQGEYKAVVAKWTGSCYGADSSVYSTLRPD